MSVVLSHLTLSYTDRTNTPPRRPVRAFGRQATALLLARRSLFGPVCDTAWAAEDDYVRFSR